MQIKYKTMKELASSEQPYEKCEQFGVESLSDAELLAVIIRSGSKNHRAVEVAENIINHSNEEQGLLGLHYMTIQELMLIPGVGKVKAIQILCVAEISKRMASKYKVKGKSFTTPKEIADYYMQRLRLEEREQLCLLMLDTKNRIIKDMMLSTGTVNASIGEPREMFLLALKYGAVFIVLIHNHPSGDPTPSKADISLTKRVIEAGHLIGIRLMDHIIIGDNTYISLRERGLMG